MHCVKFNNVFLQPFHRFEKNLNILMDYCLPMDILNGIYVFSSSQRKLIWRMERMLAMGLWNVKLWLSQHTDEQFEKYAKNNFYRFPLKKSFLLTSN